MTEALSPSAGLIGEEQALLALLAALDARGYAFVTPTPATHARVLARPMSGAPDLRAVFGWSRPFAASDLEPALLQLMREAGVLAGEGERLKSGVRVSSLGGRLFLHSAYPPEQADAVFFGPDTYRFADFLERELPQVEAEGALLDLGTGSGVGGVVAGLVQPGRRVVLADVNPLALRLARINAAHAGVAVETRHADGLEGFEGGWAAVLANPPYMVSGDGRAYREGGGLHGAELSLRWAMAAAERLAPGGRLLMYTGAAIVGGRDPFREAVGSALEAAGCDWRYRELDPDVFGEELERPEYADVDRISVVGLVAVKR